MFLSDLTQRVCAAAGFDAARADDLVRRQAVKTLARKCEPVEMKFTGFRCYCGVAHGHAPHPTGCKPEPSHGRFFVVFCPGKEGPTIDGQLLILCTERDTVNATGFGEHTANVFILPGDLLEAG